MEEVTVQFGWYPHVEFAGYLRASECGDYEAAGLSCVFEYGGPSVAPEEALANGSADIAIGNPYRFAYANSPQSPLALIGAQYRRSPLGIIGPALDPTDHRSLSGCTIAAPPILMNLAASLLRGVGLELEHEVTLVPHDGALDLLVNHGCDALVGFPFLEATMLGWHGHEMKQLMFSDLGYASCNNALCIRSADIPRRAEILSAFLRASQRGWQRNFRDPLEGTRTTLRAVEALGHSSPAPGSDEERLMTVQNSLQEIYMVGDSGSPEEFMRLDPPSMRHTRDFLNRIGVAPGGLLDHTSEFAHQ